MLPIQTDAAAMLDMIQAFKNFGVQISPIPIINNIQVTLINDAKSKHTMVFSSKYDLKTLHKL